MSTRNYLLPVLLPRKEMLIKNGEAAICAEIASYLKAETISGRLRYFWFHVSNEYAGQNRPVYGAKQTAMGKISGVPDYSFHGKYTSFLVEIKTQKGYLSENQKIVKRWCEDIEAPHYVCRSLSEVKEVIEIEKQKEKSIEYAISKCYDSLDAHKECQ